MIRRIAPQRSARAAGAGVPPAGDCVTGSGAGLSRFGGRRRVVVKRALDESTRALMNQGAG